MFRPFWMLAKPLTGYVQNKDNLNISPTKRFCQPLRVGVRRRLPGRFDMMQGDDQTELWVITNLELGKVIEMGYEHPNFPDLDKIPKFPVVPFF